MKGTGVKRNVSPGSCETTGAKFPVAPVESAPMLVTSVSWWCVYREALVDRSWWMKSVSNSTSLRKITSACDTSMLRNNGSVVSCYPLSLTALPHALHMRGLFWPQLGLNIHLKFAAECRLGHSSEVCCLLNCLLQGGYICWRCVCV